MTNTVNKRGMSIATFRHISVRLMEMLARWTPMTPEMEAKVMFGRHIWDFAQMADALGQRTFELRRPKHYTVRPVDAYEALLQEASGAQSTADRIAVVYEGVLPGLVERYRNYATTTDPILDEPSVVLIERIIQDLMRQRAEAAELQRELGLGKGAATAIVARERAIVDLVAEQVEA